MTTENIAEKVVKDYTGTQENSRFENAQASVLESPLSKTPKSSGPANVRTRNIKVMVGFYGNRHYNCDYNELFKNLDIVDYFKYINKGITNINYDYSIIKTLEHACAVLPKTRWECVEDYPLNIDVDVRMMKNERAMVIDFDIYEK